MEKNNNNNCYLELLLYCTLRQLFFFFCHTFSLFPMSLSFTPRRGNICDGWGCRWGAGTRVHLIPVNDECCCPFSQLPETPFAATGLLTSPRTPSPTDLPTYAGLIVFVGKKKSSKVVHLQTCAANLTSHLYLSERRWAPHRSAAKSVFLPFLSNVILIPYLADMQMCEVMMCLRGFSRAVKMKCSSTCRHPSLSRQLLGCVLIRIYQAQWILVSSWCIASHLDPVRCF